MVIKPVDADGAVLILFVICICLLGLQLC
jgi:hypothetical protein